MYFSEVMKGIITDYLVRKKMFANPIDFELARQAIPTNKRITSAFLVHDIALYYADEVNGDPELWRGIMLMVLEDIGVEYMKSWTSSLWRQYPQNSVLFNIYLNALNYHAKETFNGETVFDEGIEFDRIQLADTFLEKLKFNDAHFIKYNELIDKLHVNVFLMEAKRAGVDQPTH